jgi:hypothetical protein
VSAFYIPTQEFQFYGEASQLGIQYISIEHVQLRMRSEAEFLDVIGTKVLRVFLLAYGNLKSENSTETQRNCTFMKSASALIKKKTKFSSHIRKFRWDRVQSHK